MRGEPYRRVVMDQRLSRLRFHGGGLPQGGEWRNFGEWIGCDGWRGVNLRGRWLCRRRLSDCRFAQGRAHDGRGWTNGLRLARRFWRFAEWVGIAIERRSSGQPRWRFRRGGVTHPCLVATVAEQRLAGGGLARSVRDGWRVVPGIAGRGGELTECGCACENRRDQCEDSCHGFIDERRRYFVQRAHGHNHRSKPIGHSQNAAQAVGLIGVEAHRSQISWRQH